MQRIRLFIVLFSTLALAGCGSQGLKTHYVEGIITLDGQPLEDAMITFFPAAPDGKAAM
jgi:hypothetical protein